MGSLVKRGNPGIRIQFSSFFQVGRRQFPDKFRCTVKKHGGMKRRWAIGFGWDDSLNKYRVSD